MDRLAALANLLAVLGGRYLMNKFYFAYGSNLNAVDLREWAAKRGYSLEGFRAIGKAWLPDHTVGFRYNSSTRGGGVLDIVERKGHIVPGILFEVDDWAMLDAKEGAPNAYKRSTRSLIDANGSVVTAEVYSVCKHRRESYVKPTSKYVNVVCEGLQKHGLEASHVEEAAANMSPRSLCTRLFTYGTLMRGESRWPTVAKHRPTCVILAQCIGNLINFGSYPGMIDAEHNTELVRGELMVFDDIGAALHDLDSIEGFKGYESCGNLFRRTLKTVETCDLRLRLSWAYMASDGAVVGSTPPIHSNCWRTHLGRWESATAAIVEGHMGGDSKSVVDRLLYRDLIQEPKIRGRDTDSAAVLASIRNHTLSERRLAQASGKWNVVF